ncbi:tripartite tricarboxylate transporter TctB family protein [Polynucleobacter sp. AP-Nino-20-G2]|uniref:tripartite tricarboxylate transporter TctB family protein n=1 Tax=Polynucleobacter sp. AP-Nino-20-G2 TaxID=2576917 RepID=UPI001BFE6FDD|nr:tripartite tricarboxylate transporter TctB family protein [Polynucleobacter sp. AP-Nino-20-G2]QWE16349.1 tripartite tricarboxylate transporter TctB family protein [Polynucleobacter sp. AP-Nino-20-G2]
MKIRNQRDFGAGIMYMVIGLFFTVVATQYPMGTPAKMGPGYFPHYLGILMTLLGLFITIKSFSAKAAIESIPKFNWKIMAQITGAVVLYGLLLPKMGFLIAVVVLVLVSASASKEFTWKGSLINAAFLVAFTYSVFVLGLKLQFPLLPVFFQQ